MHSVENFFGIDCPSSELEIFFLFWFFNHVLKFFHFVNKKQLMTKTNFQHSDLAQIFMKIFFLFFKKYWSTYLDGQSARSAQKLKSKPAATGLDSSLGYLWKASFFGLERLDFKPFKPTNGTRAELKDLIHSFLFSLIKFLKYK